VAASLEKIILNLIPVAAFDGLNISIKRYNELICTSPDKLFAS
jgi:hypothetical protein